MNSTETELKLPTMCVIVESPFAGEEQLNEEYVRRAMNDCLLNHQEAPYASHVLYTQPGVLDDSNPSERKLGIEAGLMWGLKAEKTVVYIDRGISRGMVQGIERAFSVGRPVEFRSLAHLYPEYQSDLTVEECENHFIQANIK